MTSFFGGVIGIRMVDYLQKGYIISGAYHALLLRQLRETVRFKSRTKLINDVLLRQ